MKIRLILTTLICFSIASLADSHSDILSNIRNRNTYAHAKCIESIYSVAEEGNNVYVTVQFTAGHETCDFNQLFVSRNNGVDFVSQVIGSDACSSLHQVTQCGPTLYVTQYVGFSKYFRVFRSNDAAQSFAQIGSDSLVNTTGGSFTCEQLNLFDAGHYEGFGL